MIAKFTDLSPIRQWISGMFAILTPLFGAMFFVHSIYTTDAERAFDHLVMNNANEKARTELAGEIKDLARDVQISQDRQTEQLKRARVDPYERRIIDLDIELADNRLTDYDREQKLRQRKWCMDKIACIRDGTC